MVNNDHFNDQHALLTGPVHLVLEGVLRTGQGEAAVIKGRDPLEGMEF